MRKKLYICLLFILFSLTKGAVSQSLFLTRSFGHTTIGFDINSLYNYNIYEGHRVGGSAFVSFPVKNDKRYGSDFQNNFNITGYGAYGLTDKAWKYGGEVEFRMPCNTFRNAFVGFNHDIEIVGQHNFSTYQLLNTISNSGYFSSRFSSIDRLSIGFTLALPHAMSLMTKYRHSREMLLFSSSTLLYPSIFVDEALTPSSFDEVNLRLSLLPSSSSKRGRAIVDIIAGYATPHEDGASSTLFCRLVAQYEHSFHLGTNNNPLTLFSQAGSTILPNTPVSRRFNISGSGGSYYYFNNSFLTVRPNAFMTDIFVILKAHYALSKPLWTLSFSKPKPFIQAAGLWGALRTDKSFGECATFDLITGQFTSPDIMPTHETIMLFAPFQGLAEFAAGIEDLIRWNLIDVGAAVAYKITSKKALYYSDNIFGNLAVMVVAKLAL